MVFTEFPQERKGSPGGSDGKESACNAGDWVQSLGLEYPVGQRMATHSIILAWKIPGTEGAWWATVHGVAESGMSERLTHTHTGKKKQGGCTA